MNSKEKIAEIIVFVSMNKGVYSRLAEDLEDLVQIAQIEAVEDYKADPVRIP